MYLSVQDKDKLVWTHSSLLDPQRVNRIETLLKGESSFQNKFTFVTTYLSLEFVNRIRPVKKLALYFRAGIVGATFVTSRFFSSWAYQQSISSEYRRNLDGAPVWESKFEVPELDKRFFFLDDDNNFEPSLWHHGLNKIDKPRRFYRYST